MATEIILPRIGFDMNEGILVEWLVADGEDVKEGQPLFALETGKATEEVEAPATGKVRILKQHGETYPVGTLLGEIV